MRLQGGAGSGSGKSSTVTGSQSPRRIWSFCSYPRAVQVLVTQASVPMWAHPPVPRHVSRQLRLACPWRLTHRVATHVAVSRRQLFIHAGAARAGAMTTRARTTQVTPGALDSCTGRHLRAEGKASSIRTQHRMSTRKPGRSSICTSSFAKRAFMSPICRLSAARDGVHARYSFATSMSRRGARPARRAEDRADECNAGHLTRHRERDGTFAEIATDLALDGTRVTAIAALGQDEEREIVEERVDAAGQRARWGEPSGVPEGAQGEERVTIAQA